MRSFVSVLLVLFVLALIIVPALGYVSMMPRQTDLEIVSLLRDIRDKDVRVENLTLSLPQSLSTTISNETLKVIVANTLLDVRINESLRVFVINTPLNVNATVSNESLRVSVINTPLDVRVVESTRYYYSVHVGTSAVASNKHHLCLFNPSNRTVFVSRIMIASEVTAAVSGFQIVIRVNRVSSVSGGTSATITPFDTRNPPLNITAVTSPTGVSLIGTLFSIAINQEETGGDVFRDIVLDQSPIVLRTGEGICLTQYGTAGTGSLSLSIVFYTN